MIVFSIISQLSRLFFILLLPLAFQLGGRVTGLALSFAFIVYFGALSIARAIWWKENTLGWVIVSEGTMAIAFIIVIQLIVLSNMPLAPIAGNVSTHTNPLLCVSLHSIDICLDTKQ